MTTGLATAKKTPPMKTPAMKTLATKAFGTIEIAPSSIFAFPEGLYGFPDDREYALLEGKPDSPFLWLQSTSEEHLAFILIDPRVLMPGYSPAVPKVELEQLGVRSAAECRVFTIVTIPQNAPEEMTVNLQGPILLSDERQIGRQVISDQDEHGVRVSVLKLMEGPAC